MGWAPNWVYIEWLGPRSVTAHPVVHTRSGSLKCSWSLMITDSSCPFIHSCSSRKTCTPPLSFKSWAEAHYRNRDELLCPAKPTGIYLLTCKVSRYCLLACTTALGWGIKMRHWDDALKWGDEMSYSIETRHTEMRYWNEASRVFIYLKLLITVRCWVV